MFAWISVWVRLRFQTLNSSKEPLKSPPNKLKELELMGVEPHPVAERVPFKYTLM
jgi:hypothetical protein